MEQPFSEDKQLPTVIPILPPPPTTGFLSKFHAVTNANINVNGGVTVNPVANWTTLYDILGEFNTANPNKFTALADGYYLFGVYAKWVSAAPFGQYMDVLIMQGPTIVSEDFRLEFIMVNVMPYIPHAQVYLLAGQTVHLAAHNRGPNARTFATGSHFWGHRIS